MFSKTTLIFNDDNSVYHLGLLPEQVASTLIFVGDPERVPTVSKHFDAIEHQVARREFVTHTGRIGSQRLSVISTGIGTDNIEIVMNELDVLFNFDIKEKTFKKNLTSLQILRLGTSGSLQPEIPVDTLLATQAAVGLDSLLHFYEYENTSYEIQLTDSLADYFEEKCEELILMPYVFEADKQWLQRFMNESAGVQKGITVTSPGFYAPQGRVLRGAVIEPKLLSVLTKFRHKKQSLTNVEMETAAIYGMARILGHRAASLSVLLANRATDTFSANPQKSIDKMIEYGLKCLLA
jgi:uridine phosphorylase